MKSLPRLMIAVVIVTSLAAADWPRFRGPNGTGISEDKNIPLTWSEDENILWKVRVPGYGHSSPIVCGEKLFVQTSTIDGTKRSLLCYNVEDGKLLWSYDQPGVKAHHRRDNTLASSTPATDGERVYALFWDGIDLLLAAVDLNGKEVWKKPLGPFTSQHGAGHSPMVYDGKVFLHNDQDADKNPLKVPSRIQAFDAKSGKLIWEQPRQAYSVSYSTPMIRKPKDGPAELIVTSTPGVTAYHPDTGEIIWNWEWDWGRIGKMRMVGSPVENNGLIYAYTGNGAGNRNFVAVRAGKNLPQGTDRLAWSATRDVPYVPALLSYGDYLYGVHDAGRPLCMVAATGEVVWSERLSKQVYSSPIIIDGKVYFTDMGGKTYIFPALPKFELLAENSLDDSVFASPAVSNGRLFIRGTEYLYCIGKKE